MTVTIYGFPMSVYVQRVILTLKMTNTPFEFIKVNLMEGEQKKPEYQELNPFGTVPTLVDGDVVLYESAAIVKYIALKAKSPLAVTSSLKEEALLDQALAVEASSWDSNISPMIANLVFVPLMSGKPGNQELIKDRQGRLETKLGKYEIILGKQKYLAGDRLTIADIKHLGWGSYLTPQGFPYFQDTEKYPNLVRWWKDVSSIPEWKATQDWITENIGEMYQKSINFKGLESQ